MKNQSKSKSHRGYYLFNCRDLTLGRLASKAAFVIIGKHKADYSPHEDKGGWAIVVNSQDVKVTGRKRMNKVYHRFSGYPGRISSRKMDDLLKENPERVVREAIYGMLPKNKLRDRMMKRIKIFADENHGLKADLIRVK